ncbi:DUF4224 domain-containing protein [Mycoavidus sp. SF9855]|uniref:DUF4224 domain-containing protein n=1 Tax=Mycoavidus sp. SF9855 TaxID=2968475 RepID=UPI00211C233F|nr:DUF4224 domain-containing protein [Mycoavidus sp. SF9855]UUM20840.1 DUF4224 domain-containing protein [Mycoavidus sp. SF9855]
METSEVFLTEAQVDELTGIRRGKTLEAGTAYARKASKYERQEAYLKEQGIVFFMNVRGRPIVARAAVEGRSEEVKAKSWQPKLAIQVKDEPNRV